MAWPTRWSVFCLSVILTLLSHVVVVVHGVLPNHSMQAMISQVCTDMEDQVSCLTDIHSRLHNHNSPNRNYNDAVSVLTAATEASLNRAQLAMRRVVEFTTTSLSESSSMSREQIAVEDCKELLDLTVTELAWSLKEMRRIPATNINRNRNDGLRPWPSSASHHQPTEQEENLKAWLSAALGNQDTCLEGFQGANKDVGDLLQGSLKQVTQLISNVLTLYTNLQAMPISYRPPSSRDGQNNGTGEYSNGIPQWLTEGDKKKLFKVDSAAKGMQADAVVAVDGSGHYQSIVQAVQEAPNHNSRRYVIYVKKGVYNENIDMKKKKTNIMLIGDGIGATVISGSRNFMQGYTTFRTPTFAVSGKGFIARDITFRNMAGPHNHQAVALRVDSDQSVFYRCSMEGYQDTLYAHSLRQFYRECSIYGTIDFLFGNGAAVLQNCNFYTRPPLPMQKITITAHGRKSPYQSTGFSIQDSYVYATQPTFLGRPWKAYSRVVYMNTYMSSMVQPRGWLEWYSDFALNTLYFGEYKNYGPGAALASRVKWPGYQIIRDAAEATAFTVDRFINGMMWLPATGVRFSAGLTN